LTRLLQNAGILSHDAKCSELIGDDAVVHVIDDQIAIVENVDVFTPIHDDPFIQGEIVACNASNDIFAMGATDIISLQAFLAYPKQLTEEIPTGVLKGMAAFMNRLGAKITGGQTIQNPVPVFGGICMGVTSPSRVIYSSGAEPGDLVLLTKPLGIQPAMKSYRDLRDERRDALLARFSESELLRMQDVAVRIMTQSNLEVAAAMQEAAAHAATDVTGFGLLGHAGNVATLSCVDIIINKVPVVRGTLELASFFGHKLVQGFGAETAGGMLVFVAPEKEERFVERLGEQGLPCWPVGYVAKPNDEPSARLAENVEYIETEFP
jgi:selenide,water dikinase